MKILLLISCIAAAAFFHLPVQAQHIEKVEYFFNTDPGFGNGINVPVTPAADIVDMVVTANISSVPVGFNKLHIRSLEANGNWSITNTHLFYKAHVTATPVISQVEYFINIDPGFGNGINVPVTAAATVTDLAINPDISSLSSGLHRICFRSRDNNGSWSQVNAHFFYKSGSSPSSSVSYMEYFIDVDPGFGNGNPLMFTPGSDIQDAVYNINIASLAAGVHQLFIRSKDNNGNWSISNFAEFNKTVPLPLTWKSFVAQSSGKNVQLQWIVANEANTSYFEVQHSTDGIMYSVLAVQSAVNNSLLNTYHYTHANAAINKTNFYRIRQVDKDSRYSFSDTRLVRFGMQPVSVGPNPATDFIMVNSVEDNISIHLFSSNGQKISSHLLTGNALRISLSFLSKGTYMLVTEKDGKVLQITKVIKQ